MTRLYVANCTVQVQGFNYRLVEVEKAFSRTIEIGGQVDLGDLTDPQINGVIEQNRKYGLLGVEEIARMEGFTPLIFSTGRPVRADVMRRVISHNRTVLRARGEEARKAAAVVVNNQLSSAGPLELLEMSIVEEKAGKVVSGVPDTPGAPVAEGIRIVSGAGGDAPQPPRRRRRAA